MRAPGDFDDAPVVAWKRSAGLAGRPYFCLSASALPMSAPREGYAGEVVRLVERLQRVTPQGVLIAKDSSCQYLRDVAKATGAAFFGPEHGFTELWSLLRDASFLVSGHYHNVIMAAMVGCPFVPLTTMTHKMQGVCRLLGWHITEPHDATYLSTEADRIGLVSRVVPDGQVVDEAVSLAGEIVANSPLGVWMTKEVMWSNLEVGSLRAGIDLENRTQILTTFTEDQAEAVRAFLEKRPPVFRNR